MVYFVRAKLKLLPKLNTSDKMHIIKYGKHKKIVRENDDIRIRMNPS